MLYFVYVPDTIGAVPRQTAPELGITDARGQLRYCEDEFVFRQTRTLDTLKRATIVVGRARDCGEGYAYYPPPALKRQMGFVFNAARKRAGGPDAV